MPRIPFQRFTISLLLASGLLTSTGCLVTHVRWRAPKHAHRTPIFLIDPADELAQAESLYNAAVEHERNGEASCVDLYFEVAVLSAACATSDGDCRACRLHRSALSKLVSCGQQFGRLDPRCGLLIEWRNQPLNVPIKHRGFVWQSADFEHLVPVGEYKTNAFRNIHRRSGIGLPVVVKSSSPRGRPLVTPLPHFVATLVLQVPGAESPMRNQGVTSLEGCSIELHDPLRVDHVSVRGCSQPLAKDTSAAFAYRLRNQSRTILHDFMNPVTTARGESRLYMLEPYQAGKIPVVFIHGLLSDPFTWVDMVNDLQATPGFIDHFQMWVFEYPSGQSFLASAATLRQQLAVAYQVCDRGVHDPGLENMVLVGHSMGGLLAKLQIACSSDTLWDSVASRPLEGIITDGETRQQLKASFFFEPSTHVSRVVFIGTPHHGSSYSQRLVGRLGSSLVREPEERKQIHQQLIACNPGVFADEVSKRIPTSIDMLEPDSILLETVASLPISQRVRMHSIMGNGKWTVGYGPSDGVVPVQSAFEPRALSECYVDEKHAELNKHPETVNEVIRILAEHRSALRPDPPVAEAPATVEFSAVWQPRQLE